MAQRTLLITDFFPKCRSTSVSNGALLKKSLNDVKLPKHSTIQNKVFDDNLNQCISNIPLDDSTMSPILRPEGQDMVTSNETVFDKKKYQTESISPLKSSIPSQIKFARHHSAPLHHRSPIKMRERLMGQEDLEDIRKRIRAFRNDLYKYKLTYSRSPIKRPCIIMDTPSSPFKLPVPRTSLKSYPSIPAYEHFNSLVTTVELPLPNKYEVLLEQYKHLDFLVCHTHNNEGISTFEKVQQVIQQKTRRNFNLQTLGRMKTIHPTMYRFRQEKIQLPTLSPVKLKYQLTITPTDFDIQSNMQITPSIIVERINCFRHILFNLVKRHHRTFLSNKLHLKVEELPNDENLARWHPDFDLQSVPDIDVSSLPESPDEDNQQLLVSPSKIHDYAEKTPSQRVKRALFSTFSNDDTSSTITLPSPSKETFSIYGIHSSLVDKIRSKETNKLFSNTNDHHRQMLSRLEQTIEIVQQFFIVERATSLELDLVAKQVRDCHSGPLSYKQSIETLHFLHTYPANDGWFSMITIRGKSFIKVNRHKSINTIIQTIHYELKKLG